MRPEGGSEVVVRGSGAGRELLARRGGRGKATTGVTAGGEGRRWSGWTVSGGGCQRHQVA